MASKELIALVAKAIKNNPPKITRFKDMETLDFSKVVDYTPTAEAAIITIRAALQEPTEWMDAAAYKMMLGPTATRQIWSGLLNASPLGEQSE